MSAFDLDRIGRGLPFARALPALRDAMRQHGYDNALQRRLLCDNWLSALERIWH